MQNPIYILCLSALIVPLAIANTDSNRQNFLTAEKALNRGDQKTWKRLQPKLKHYPLYADLLFKQALQKITKATTVQVEQALSDLQNTPLYKTYLKSWLQRLANQRQWKNYVKYYEVDLGNRYQCHYADALYRTGRPEEAFNEARSLWLVGKSQNSHCDPVFAAMKKYGQLSNALIWERIGLAMRKGQVSLVKYLRKSLPQYEQGLVSDWLKIRDKPERILEKKYIESEVPRIQEFVVYGIKRIALFEADKALQEWTKIKSKVRLSEADKRDIERYIALRMTTQRLDGAVDQHRIIPEPDKEILEWGVRAAIREADMKSITQFIDQMGDITTLHDRWKFWKAESAANTGDHATADTLFHTLAVGRGYHNFLAADKVNLPYRFNHKPLQYEDTEIRHLQNHYNVRRAEEFYAMDRINEARREWYYLIKQFGDEDRQKLTYIQKQWGWHSQAVMTIATTDYYDDLNIRFPVVFKNEIKAAITKNNLDIAWIMALVRQESAFQRDARSHAGARGLMQLMPATSQYVAKMLGIRKPKLHDLYQPKININLGTAYLKTNLARFGDNKVLATAAYNAGPGRVKKWLPAAGTMQAYAWAETIPFKETRNYVQRVMSYAAIYDNRFGVDVKRLAQRMRVIRNMADNSSNPKKKDKI